MRHLSVIMCDVDDLKSDSFPLSLLIKYIFYSIQYAWPYCEMYVYLVIYIFDSNACQNGWRKYINVRRLI
jgi:hypothetical protein